MLNAATLEEKAIAAHRMGFVDDGLITASLDWDVNPNATMISTHNFQSLRPPMKFPKQSWLHPTLMTRGPAALSLKPSVPRCRFALPASETTIQFRLRS